MSRFGEALQGRLARAEHSGGDITEVRGLIRAVSRDLEILESETLEEALGRVLRLCTSSHVEALAARLGWDGGGGTSLQEAGDRAGLTRERIRQLENKVRDAMSKISFLPAVDRAIEILDAAAERFEADVDTLLAEEGVSKIKFLPKGVATAADFLGRKYRFQIGEDGVCVQLEGDKDLKPLRNALLSLTDVNHVAPVPELQARVSEATGREPTAEAVRHFLDRHPRIVWLDSEHNWFWDGTARLRYNNYARKVLAISSPISIASLRDGVLRHHRARNMSLPRSTFEGLCRALGFDVRDGMVSLRETIRPKDILGSIELKFLTVLQENQNVLDSKAFRDACYSRGVNRHSFWVYLSYSPILERLAPGVYALRGADVDPARVAHLTGRTSETRGGLQDHGWTKDGAIWLGYTVADNLRDSGVVTIPSAVQRLLGSQRLEAVAVDGTPIGTLIIGSGSSAGSAWGLGSFITRRGVDVGDSLILTIDTELEIACVQAGSKDLLVGFQEGEGWGPQHYLEEATRPADSSEPDIGAEYRSSGAA